ncbi:hypothetical protein Tco_0154122 [Tanacetum coccineum]
MYKIANTSNILLGYGRECRGDRYVSELRRNLISLGTLKKEGFTVKMQSSKIKVIKGSLVVLSGTISDWVEDQDGSPSSAIRFKTPIDMLGLFGWLASKRQGMLEPVKVKCIFLGYRKGVMGNKALEGVEFEVEPQEVEPHRNVDHVAGSQEVQTQDLIYYHLARDREQHSTHELFSYREDSNKVAFAVATVDKIYAHKSLTFNNTVACEVISKWKDGLKEDIDVRSDVYVLSNDCRKNSDDNHDYYWEYTPDHNEKLVYILLKGHSILSLEGSLSGDYDVEKNDVGMLDKFDRGLQTDVQVFVDFDYAMAGYMTLTKAAKEAIWLKGLAIESEFELKIVAGIATRALSKAVPRSRLRLDLKLLRIEDF